MEKKVPVNSNNAHFPQHSGQKKLRICLDPRDLNEASECEPYYTKSIEEILGKFHGMTRFTIADFSKGYWMVELHLESRKLTTMALDIGKFQWTQLSMGSIISQDVFQRKLDTIFLDVPGVTGIADDMIIYGKTDQEHDGNLLHLLEVCRNNNLILNPDEMQFRLPKVSFFGHTWSNKGLSADPKKIEAVKRMEIPQDVETMRSFLGMINYLNRFSPHLAELSNPLREICRQKLEFKLMRACRAAFQCCKDEISKNITLPYYNPKASMNLQTDASKRGLGAVLLQNSAPVMFASRELTGSERNYQNLERVFSHNMGNRKAPLLSIWQGIYIGDRSEATSIDLQETYGGNISKGSEVSSEKFPISAFDVRYRKGVEIPLADALSRVTPLPMEEDGIQLPIIAVNLVTANIPYSSNELDIIHEETRKDPAIKLLMHYINIGWPCE